MFVIQKHAATRLHYDFRIEVDGALRSWAIPKGPSLDPREKRLARQVEDHPLEYADFEGVIPKDQYGGGTVLVWDRGTYRNITTKNDREVPMLKALKNGHVTIKLNGRKLKGGFAFIRTGDGGSRRWLLVKVRDKQADARRNPVSTEPKSVLTGRTLRQVRSGKKGAKSK